MSAAATDTDRRDFGASVDAFLPGYSTHPGWYDEIERYFFPELPRRTPDVRAALTELADESNNDVRLAQPEKARLLLALAIITRLGRLDPQCALPKLATADSDLAIESLAAVGPGSLDPGQRRDNARAFYNETFAPGVPERFVTKDAFDELRRTALTGGAIGGETAATPVCDAAVVTVGGVPAVVVDSAFTDDTVTLTNLKKIVNPYNWNENYPAFFARMDRCPEMICPDGWRRVLESVDFFDGVRIRTPLKYLPITENPGFAMLEYDLDMSNFDSGDRRVLVDRGYINMFASNPAHDPDQPGVRVQTRKVVHIDGMSPFAQQRLVCITGYGTASSDFLLGPAGRCRALRLPAGPGRRGSHRYRRPSGRAAPSRGARGGADIQRHPDGSDRGIRRPRPEVVDDRSIGLRGRRIRGSGRPSAGRGTTGIPRRDEPPQIPQPRRSA